MTDPAIPEIDFDTLMAMPTATGHAPAGRAGVTVVRALTEEDLEQLLEPGAQLVPQAAPTVASLRHSHHQLARLLATGAAPAEASLITGYALATIYRLQSNDPAFKELLAFYARERREMFTDTLERMRVLGLSSLDELQQRLEDNPAGFSNREVMELAELLLVKPGRVGQATSGSGSGGPPGGTTINIKFVTAPGAVGAGPGAIIEGKVNAA